MDVLLDTIAVVSLFTALAFMLSGMADFPIHLWSKGYPNAPDWNRLWIEEGQVVLAWVSRNPGRDTVAEWSWKGFSWSNWPRGLREPGVSGRLVLLRYHEVKVPTWTLVPFPVREFRVGDGLT